MSRLGELLVRENLISLAQLQKAQDEQRRTGARLGFSLTKLGILGEAELTGFLSKQYGVPAISLSDRAVAKDILQLVPGELSKRHQLIPVQRNGATLMVAMADPSNIYAIDDLKFRTGLNIEVVVASEVAIDQAIQRYYERQPAPAEIARDSGGEPIRAAEKAPQPLAIEPAKSAEVVEICNGILLSAIKKRASDIHIEPYERSFRVRFRVDGVLQEEQNLPLHLREAIGLRFKALANLDLDERRLPQDGGIRLKIEGEHPRDFRITVLPTQFGEKIALRTLDRSNAPRELSKLELDHPQLADFMRAIHAPGGMVLITGPTGSGKTTTLYAALEELNQSGCNISTVEDPVEYSLAGVNQVQTSDTAGLTAATALRSLLRQDPNVIMVGELRDRETAAIAFQAALDGHLLLSTLHTHDAPSVLTRLVDMGVEPFVIASSVRLIVAQRLVRRICKDCARPIETDVKAMLDLGVDERQARSAQLFEGRGCRSCADTGYQGRVAIFEVLPMNDSLTASILRGASRTELRAEAIAAGMKSLRASAIEKLLEGETTLEEILRASTPEI